jgi:hypothetical protein
MTRLIRQANIEIRELNNQAYSAYFLGALALALAFTYIYFMNALVYERYRMEKLGIASADRRVELQKLESEYILKLAELDAGTPAKLGLVAANAKFVRVPSGMAMAGRSIQ